MSKNQAKLDLVEKVKTLLSKITNLSIRPQFKLKLLKFAIYSKLKFELKIYDFSYTWISNELDSIVCYHIRKWLELPVSSCVSEMCRLPLNKGGLNIPSLVEIASSQRLTTRHALKHSSNLDIQQLWHETSTKNINIDVHLGGETMDLKTSKKSLKLKFETAALDHVKTLSVQGVLVNCIIENLSPSQISKWVKEVELLSATLFCFIRKALQQQLATAANLHRWGKITDGLCALCRHPQTNKHVLNNCSAPAALERYKIRHDAILRILCNWLLKNIPSTAILHADILADNLKPIDDIFNRLRPDIVVRCTNKVQILELTICHETNLINSKQYKLDKYKNLKDDLKINFTNLKLEVFTIELSSLGLMGNVSDCIRALTDVQLPHHVYREMVGSVIGNSYNIYRNRNSSL